MLNKTEIETRRKYSYFFLLVGLFLILSLFFPVMILPFVELTQLRHAFVFLVNNCWLSLLFLIVLPLLFLFMPFKQIRDFIINTYNHMLESIENILLTAFVFVSTIILNLFLFNLIHPALYSYDSYLAFSIHFIGLFYIISSVRELNKLDRMEFYGN